MRPTVDQQLRSRAVLVREPGDLDAFINRELLTWARQTRQATNYVSRQRATFTTFGTGTFTTIWSSQDIAVGTVFRIDANVIGVGATLVDRAAFTITGLFFSDGTVQQEGATVPGYTQNIAGYAVQYLVVDNHIELQAQDAGSADVKWTAVIDAQEGP